jgi:hypothetical protein
MNSRRTHVFRWRGLPEGEYTVRATVTYAEGRHEVATHRLSVIQNLE